MKEFQIITDGNELNRCYNAESIAIDGSNLIIVMKEEESDDFLDEFVHGKTSYKVSISTDTVTIRLKYKVFARNYLYSEDENQLFSFIIGLSPEN